MKRPVFAGAALMPAARAGARVTLLPNDPRNACFGCGPGHPVGLRLAFARDGDAVTTTLAATPQREGLPQRLHSGLLHLAMLETANWTLYGLCGRVGIPVRTGALAARRWVATGETLRLAGRLMERSPGEVVVTVEATDGAGAQVATLERAYALVSRAEFLARLGYDAVPPGYEDALPE